MTYLSMYRCDGPTCVDEIRAENDEELLLEGWLVLIRSAAPGDPDAHEEVQLDFCGRGCLSAWLDDNGGSW